MQYWFQKEDFAFYSTMPEIIRICWEDAVRRWRRRNATLTTTTTPASILPIPEEEGLPQDNGGGAESGSIER